MRTVTVLCVPNSGDLSVGGADADRDLPHHLAVTVLPVPGLSCASLDCLMRALTVVCVP